MSATPYKKKLIEVAIPLEAINAASAREKSIRHGRRVDPWRHSEQGRVKHPRNKKT